MGTLLIYRHSLFFGFNTDAFVFFFKQAKSGFLATLSWDGTRHYIPVTALWIYVQHLFLGSHQPAYQILNVLQHGVTAFMVCLLARQMKLSSLQALLAGMIFLCAGSSYQVVCWSVACTSYLVSSFFYLGALLVFLRHLQSGSTKPSWTTAVLFVLSVFSHEQSVSLYPLCIVAVFLLNREDRDPAPSLQKLKEAIRRTFQLVWPLTISLIVFLVSKWWMTLHLNKNMLRGTTDFYASIEGLSRGILRCVSFRAIQPSLAKLTGPLGFAPWAITLLSVVILFFLLQARGRLLLLWITGHILMMQIATGITPRYIYLPTAAASILIVNILFDLLSPKGHHKNPGKFSRSIYIISTMLVFGALFYFSLSDLHNAQNNWAHTDRMIRGLENRLADIAGKLKRPGRLVLLNAPAKSNTPFGIFAFKNGLWELTRMATPGKFRSMMLVHTPKHQNNVNGSITMTLSECSLLLRNQDTVIFRFDDTTGRFSLLKVPPEALSKALATNVEIANPASIPELEWIFGKHQPYVQILPGETIETTLDPPSGERPWFFVSWLNGRDRKLELQVGETWKAEIKSTVSFKWETSLFFPLSTNPRAEKKVVIRNLGRLELRINRFGFFRPRRILSVETAPDLNWNRNGILEIPAGNQQGFPIPIDIPHPLVQILYSGEAGRQIEARMPSGKLIELEPGSISPTPWISSRAKLPPTHSLLISSIGPEAAWIKEISFHPDDKIPKLSEK